MSSTGSGGDAAYDRILRYAEERGLELYPHQEEAILELLAGNNVVLATPTGSGKSLVAMAAAMAAQADDRVTFYTAPIKALVSEKFFELCAVFGADEVGMLTGDVAVNADAPIICCTAEILANIALREGATADVGMVVMDEFHFYGEPGRGWAWQVPLVELPQAQFLLMSATLGDMTALGEDLTGRNGRDTAIVDQAERPVPLDFQWSLEPMADKLEELVSTGQGPVYVVHFTQAAAVEHATSLLGSRQGSRQARPPHAEEIAAKLVDVRFSAGFGKTLVKLLKAGIGVHHAGMLPRYRRLVEQLAQQGLLTVICGTDTLGVGINVPIRTVLFTALAKYDGTRMRVLKTREFLQIAGRAGRAGYDTAGTVVVQAPEHIIENEKAKAKSAAKNAAMSEEKRAKRASKPTLKKPPPGTVVWTEQTYLKLVEGRPEPLQSRMKVDNAMLVNVFSREESAFSVMERLLLGGHESRADGLRLARRAIRLTRSLVTSGVLTRLEAEDGFGRRYVLTEDLPIDFALNQPLAHFALEVLDVLDRDAATYTLDVVSVVEAVLEAPRPLLMAQQFAARGEVINALKAEGVEYDERMALVEDVTWPQPLVELLEPLYETYREHHPWLDPDALGPKSVVREMWETGMGFTDLVARYQLARSEGLVLRYLTDVYRALRQTVGAAYRTEELELLIDWLGETVRQVDSSLLDEWEALSDPSHATRAVAEHAPPPPPRPLSQQGRVFEVMVRNAMWRRVDLVARDKVDELAALDPDSDFGADDWDAAIEDYYAEHDRVLTDGDARGPSLLTVERSPSRWQVTQTIHDPAGHHDWVVEASVDLAASDEAGEAVVRTIGMRRLGG
ncbi:DEAD/DEAH box helicase [Nocardioides montaniterrae]